jgi:hypothetical protein
VNNVTKLLPSERENEDRKNKFAFFKRNFRSWVNSSKTQSVIYVNFETDKSYTIVEEQEDKRYSRGDDQP